MVAFTLQIVSQKKMPSHIVSMIFLLESPFAAFFGYQFLGETLSGLNLMGCALILISVGLIPLAEHWKNRSII
jgi:drug/metabolite transporter (DMT)-like permease